MAKRLISFDEILRQPNAAEAWEKLRETVPESDLRGIQRRLVALANRRRSFEYDPPSPRDATRFAAHLEKDAQRIRKFTLYFGAGLPLGDAGCRNLAEAVERYARALKDAAQTRRKQRQSMNVPEDELEILGLLDQSLPRNERKYYIEATTILQAAYNAGRIRRTVDPGQLRKLYHRRSLQHRLSPHKRSRNTRISTPDS